MKRKNAFEIFCEVLGMMDVRTIRSRLESMDLSQLSPLQRKACYLALLRQIKELTTSAGMLRRVLKMEPEAGGGTDSNTGKGGESPSV